ncbi:MAG: right-handed parallel beta-helix repeat-containing protein [Pirellulaceae bacterium]
MASTSATRPTGAIVRNNVVWGNRDSGIQFNADGSLPGDGVHSDNVIEGNIIYGNGNTGGGAAINLTACKTV